MVVPKGIVNVRKAIAEILEDEENSLTSLFRGLLNELYEELIHLDERIASVEGKLAAIAVYSMKIANGC